MPKSLAEFEALTGDDALTEAERKLIAACRAGEACILGDGSLPPEGKPSKARAIRAELLRVLITGGTPACDLHDSGVVLIGGHVTGQLDLRHARGRGNCVLDACRFDHEPRLDQATLAMLSLQGSHLPGLFAQGIKVSGNVFLRTLKAKGTVDVNGADIGGQLAFTGAELDGDGGKALSAQGVKTVQSVFLRPLRAKGTVDVNGADIGGQLSCTGAELDGMGGEALNAQGVKTGQSVFLSTLKAKGTVAVNGAEIGGQLDCTGAELDGMGELALRADKITVAAGVFWRQVKAVAGSVDLAGARIGELIDDMESWTKVSGDIHLDGFTYGRIDASSPLSFAARKAWLAKGSQAFNTFSPQPYTQLAKVLREMGHDREARKVLMARESLLNQRARQNMKVTPNGDVDVAFRSLWWDGAILLHRLWHGFLFLTIGYGFAPGRAFWAMLGLVLPSAWAYSWAYGQGLIVPNSDVILTSPGWLVSMLSSLDAPTLLWDDGLSARHYETFYGLAYAFDVFIPLVDLGQQSAWSATTISWAGWAIRIGTMGLEVLGWVITALGAAALTGLIQRDRGP